MIRCASTARSNHHQSTTKKSGFGQNQIIWLYYSSSSSVPVQIVPIFSGFCVCRIRIRRLWSDPNEFSGSGTTLSPLNFKSTKAQWVIKVRGEGRIRPPQNARDFAGNRAAPRSVPFLSSLLLKARFCVFVVSHL